MASILFIIYPVKISDEINSRLKAEFYRLVHYIILLFLKKKLKIKLGDWWIRLVE